MIAGRCSGLQSNLRAFGRLKCAFLKWKLTLRPRCSCRVFPPLRDLRVLLCRFSSLFAAQMSRRDCTMVARLRKAYVATAEDGCANLWLSGRRSLRRRPGSQCLEYVRERSPSRRDGVIMYSRVSLQRSCWHVLSSEMESTAAPTQSS